MDCSPPGSSVHGILQARILEWVAIQFSRGSSQLRDWTQVSSIAGRFFTIWATRETLYTGVGCHALLQGIFPTQRLNPGLSHALHVDSLPSESCCMHAKSLQWYSNTPGSSIHRILQARITGVGCHFLLHLSHEGSPRILEWVAYPFSRGTSQPRNWIRVSCIAGGFFTSWATQETSKDGTQGDFFFYFFSFVAGLLKIVKPYFNNRKTWPTFTQSVVGQGVQTWGHPPS